MYSISIVLVIFFSSLAYLVQIYACKCVFLCLFAVVSLFICVSLSTPFVVINMGFLLLVILYIFIVIMIGNTCRTVFWHINKWNCMCMCICRRLFVYFVCYDKFPVYVLGLFIVWITTIIMIYQFFCVALSLSTAVCDSIFIECKWNLWRKKTHNSFHLHYVLLISATIFFYRRWIFSPSITQSPWFLDGLQYARCIRKKGKEENISNFKNEFLFIVNTINIIEMKWWQRREDVLHKPNLLWKSICIRFLCSTQI